jgi:hypothetical protein
MGQFTITPRRKAFWLVRTERDGSRTPVERFATEDEAIDRLKALQRRDEIAGRLAAAAPRKPLL